MLHYNAKLTTAIAILMVDESYAVGRPRNNIAAKASDVIVAGDADHNTTQGKISLKGTSI